MVLNPRTTTQAKREHVFGSSMPKTSKVNLHGNILNMHVISTVVALFEFTGSKWLRV